MAKARLTVTIRLADIDKMRAMLWELRMLCDRMRVEASPYAEPLEHALDRFTDGGNDDDRVDER